MYGIRYCTVRFDGGAVSIPPSLPQRASETLQPDSPSRGRPNRGSSPGGCGMRDGSPRILEVGESYFGVQSGLGEDCTVDIFRYYVQNSTRTFVCGARYKSRNVDRGRLIR